MVRPATARRHLLRACAIALLLGCGGSGGTLTTDPPARGVTSVQITAGTATVAAGATLALTATARDAAGATVASATIAWTSSAQIVATVSPAGLVTGVAPGTTIITASAAGVSATLQVTVTPDETPASITFVPPGAIVLVSGATATLGVTVRAPDGHTIAAPTVVFTSSDATVASVAGNVLTGARAGTAVVVASSGTAAAAVTVTVTAGPAATLAVRVPPGGAVAGSPLATQPVLEIRDRAGNLVPSAANAVSAAIATGGGSLSGVTTVAAVAGVATFTNLAVTGTPGTRALAFSATGLTPVTSGDFTLAASATPLLAIDTTSLALSLPSGKSAPAVTLGVRNGGTPALAGVTLSAPAYDAGQPTGWLTVSASGSAPPFTVTLLATAATLVAGSYRAVVQVIAPAASNSPVPIVVTLTVLPANTISYGGPGEKLRILDAGSAYAPALTARDGTGQSIPVGAATFVSRATSVATVDAQGRITAVGEGTTWVSVAAAALADSVFVTVPRTATGPVLRSDLGTFLVKAGDVTFVTVLLDTRQVPIGAATVAVGYTTATAVFGFNVTYTIPSGPPAPVATSTTAGVIRVSVASATPLTGQVTLLRLRVPTPAAGTSGVITLTVTDIVAPDGTDLMSVTTSTRIPIIVQ